MRQLVVIGNGFDLARKMNTKLSDYMKNFVEKKFMNSESEDQNTGRLETPRIVIRNILEKDVHEIKDLEKRFDDLHDFNINFFDFLMLAYQEMPYKSLENMDWRDVEGILSNVIDRITDRDEFLRENETRSLTLFRYFYSRWSVLERTIDSIEDKSTNTEAPNDLEKIIYSYLVNKYKRENFLGSPNFFDIDNDLSINFMLDQLWDELTTFEENFNDYLVQNVETEEELTKRKVINYPFVEKLFTDTIFLTNESSSIDTNVLNFNYTALSVESNEFSIKKERHVHGVIIDRNSRERSKLKTNIIFGIDNADLDSQKPSEYRFSKAYRIFELANRLSPFTNQHLENVLDSDFQAVKFFGHGLGLADRTYFFQIFDHINLFEKSSNTKLIFYVRLYGDFTIEEIKEAEYSKVSKLINSYARARSEKNLDIELLSSLVMRNQIEIKEL